MLPIKTKAKYAGICGVCGLAFEVGDEIYWWPRYGVAHAHCYGIEERNYMMRMRETLSRWVKDK